MSQMVHWASNIFACNPRRIERFPSTITGTLHDEIAKSVFITISTRIYGKQIEQTVFLSFAICMLDDESCIPNLDETPESIRNLFTDFGISKIDELVGKKVVALVFARTRIVGFAKEE